MFKNKTITLPKADSGTEVNRERYVLTKEAVDVIKRASSLVFRWESSNGFVSENCWFKAIIKSKVEGEDVEVNYFMPVNTTGIDHYRKEWKACGGVDYLSPNEQHPLQALVKEGDMLLFNPYPSAHTNNLVKEAGLVADVIFFEIWRGTKRDKVIRGYFAGTITQPDNPTRAAFSRQIPSPVTEALNK